jgi:hypothetical protein
MWSSKALVLLVPTVIGLLACSPVGSDEHTVSTPDTVDALAPGEPCNFDSLTDPGNKDRRFALLIGVSKYSDESGIKHLKGAHADAGRMKRLLTDPGGFNFDPDNVCLMTNENATSARFIAATNALKDNVAEEDLVIIYFAGHGSQTPDDGGTTGDEPDRMDETIIFYDGVEVVDDLFNEIIAGLHTKTDRITVVLDSCNSGSAFRALDPGTARWEQPDQGRPKLRPSPGSRDLSEGFVNEHLADVVYLVAADDGTPALEKGARGVFTSALLETISQNGDRVATYDQLEPLLVDRVSRHSAQRPSFHGATNRFIFDNQERVRVSALRVTGVSSEGEDTRLELTGPLIFGVDKGAILSVYDGSLAIEKVSDPLLAKARAIVESRNGFHMTARVSEHVGNTNDIFDGDFAVLVQPTESIQPTPFFVANAVDRGLLSAMQLQYASYPGLSETNDRDAAKFQLFAANGQLVLSGPSGYIRNSFCLPGQQGCRDRDNDDAATTILEVIKAHAFHSTFANLQGEGADILKDEESVRISITPSSRATQEAECAGRTVGATGDGIVTVPICPSYQSGGYAGYYYDVAITLDPSLPPDTKLFVGGVVFWNDGSRQALTRSVNAPLTPGDGEVLLDPPLRSGPPLHALDHIMVFATSEPVDWIDMTHYTRSLETPPSPVESMLAKVRLGSRGGSGVVKSAPYGIWTHTSAYTRVEPNPRFAEPAGEEDPIPREYTIAGFDIRPYLPDDPGSSLRQVLTQAHELTIAGGADGHRYEQHSWEEGSDEADLARGIDCSRSIWYAFTRAGLSYTLPGSASTKEYLPTVSMVSTSSPLSNNFERCDDQSLQLGDVLVYRDDGRGDGHTVMVIDPVSKVGWGSHNWDGNGRTPGFVKDTGVEYQLIKIKPDWERWDRTTMFQKACWRHRSFTDESRANTGAAIEQCDASLNCSL